MGEAKEIKNEHKKNGINLIINDNQYKFLYEEQHSSIFGDEYSYADLELYLNEEKILHINESIDFGEYYTSYSPISVDTFIKGDWVKDFEELKNEIEKEKELSKKKDFENPEEIEKLKKNFGIQ